MLFTEFGIMTFEKLVLHPSKADAPIFVTLEGMVPLFNASFVHPSKAQSDIVVRESGSEIVPSFEQLENAPSPMEVMFEFHLTIERLVQLPKV